MSEMSKVFTTSRRVLSRDFGEKWLQDRVRELSLEIDRKHRKIWEFAAICQVVYLDNLVQLNYPVKCLGFGCGKEPIPAWLANRHCKVIATDAPSDNAGWTETSQRAMGLNDLPWMGICRSDFFADNVDFRQVDMNQIPDDLLRGDFDFTWSCGSFEHIGGIDASLNFFCNQMRALKPGGIAAHTTEYNFGSDTDTINTSDLVLFRKQDLERLDGMLEAQGDRLFTLDLRGGDTLEDQIVDVYPYTNPVHLALQINEHVSTSIILIAQRGQ